MVVSSAILRVRRDHTGPPLSGFIDRLWIASFVAIPVWGLPVWIADLADRWLLWPLAVFAAAFLTLVVWDTVRAVMNSRKTAS